MYIPPSRLVCAKSLFYPLNMLTFTIRNVIRPLESPNTMLIYRTINRRLMEEVLAGKRILHIESTLGRYFREGHRKPDMNFPRVFLRLAGLLFLRSGSHLFLHRLVVIFDF